MSDEEVPLLMPLPSLESVRKKFEQQECLQTEQALQIIHEALNIMDKESNLLYLDAPVVVFGDIHGQFFDLMKLMDKIEFFSHHEIHADRKLLFLGDYVDRGVFSCEVILFLFLMKIKFPERVFLLRGNHECEAISTFYGFKMECKAKYGISVYLHFVKCFQTLPLAAVIDSPEGRVFCVHAGLSPDIETLQDIEALDRRQEPATSGGLCDLLWSDPIPEYEEEDTRMSSPVADPTISRRSSIIPEEILWKPNDVRGCSYYYNCTAVYKFLTANNLLCMVRAHELQDEGYVFHFSSNSYTALDTRPDKTFPPVITVFSAANYCDEYQNLAAYLIIQKSTSRFEVEQTSAVKHPFPKAYDQSGGMWNMFESTLPYIPASTEFFQEMARLNNVSLDDNTDGTTVDKSFVQEAQWKDGGNESEEEVGLDLEAWPQPSNLTSLYYPSNADVDVTGLTRQRQRQSCEKHPLAFHKTSESDTAWQETNPNSTAFPLSPRISPEHKSIFSTKELDVLKLMFSLMDVDGDSVLGPEEVGRFIERILGTPFLQCCITHPSGTKLSDYLAQQYTAALDCNKDGLVDLSDLLTCAATCKAKYRAKLEAAKTKLPWFPWWWVGSCMVLVLLVLKRPYPLHRLLSKRPVLLLLLLFGLYRLLKQRKTIT